ncbi:carboxypeptidase-like regulatory domain-containing protein [Saccharothrix texasensis]|uniref:SdrD B-like protein n=1 Tax=Saccharothrix texasensis TaxID=103734 RepID=A0A3N1H9G2_9PSEU|nr:carboxypeptidase-like regulatory domain-containing protein [Saccharothrix texasensis]ROP39154.1 hypothetical protein EDD40_4533 [Saccharothrix texasensis]
MTLSKRVVARRSLAFVAALAVTATLSAAARAQEPVPSTAGGAAPVQARPAAAAATAAQPTVSQPTVSQPTAPQSAGSPPATGSTTSSPTAAAAARLAISATVGAGPFLVGEQIPVEVTVANDGDADATGVMASAHSSAGSAFFVPSSEWGELATWPGPGITLPAGQRRVLTARGEVQGWSGAPVVKFLVRQGNASVAEHVLPLPVRDPGSAADDLGGLVYGDLDGDNAPDAGEALHGVRVTASTNGPPWLRLEATTGVDGRFRFADLPVQVYALSLDDAPDGWVVGSGYSRVAVDGRGSAATLLLRATRPLTDHLSAAMRFTRDVYQVGDQAQVEVTLTNSGAADLTGVKAACDRVGGGGPELRDVVFGELGRDAPGVTVPAGRSRVVTMTGRVSEAAVGYGAVNHVCDFGPAPDSPGRPEAYALAKVPGPAVTARMSFHHDRDGDRLGEPDEVVAGAVVVLRDAVTRRVVVEGRTDAQGRVRFDDLPSGPYEVRVHGSWKLPSGGGAPLFAGTCDNCRAERSLFLLPGPDPTKAHRAGG